MSTHISCSWETSSRGYVEGPILRRTQNSFLTRRTKKVPFLLPFEFIKKVFANFRFGVELLVYSVGKFPWYLWLAYLSCLRRPFDDGEAWEPDLSYFISADEKAVFMGSMSKKLRLTFQKIYYPKISKKLSSRLKKTTNFSPSVIKTMSKILC